jgi:uncharacterized protein
MTMGDTASWRPLPRITLDSEEFWKSTREHAMRLQKCDKCGEFRYYPSEACHNCGSLEYQWLPVSGKGEIHTFTVLHRARGNPFENETPIAIILVTLDEGPTMMSNLIDYEDADLAIGQRVEVDYEDVNDEVTLPVFRPVR